MKQLIPLAFALSFATTARAETIMLICMGDGNATRHSVTSAYGLNSNGNSAWVQGTSERSVGFGDQVDLEINSEGLSKIRMPRAMLPSLHGGKDGWFKLDDVKFSDSSITATAQVSIINSPKVRVDRMTGRISINGKSGDYSGECRKSDPATERKF